MKTNNAVAFIPTRSNGLVRPARVHRMTPAEAMDWVKSLPDAVPHSCQYIPALQALRKKGYSLAEATRLLESRTDFAALTLQTVYYEKRHIYKEAK